MPAQNVFAFSSQSASQRAVDQVKKRVNELSKMHPVALVVMALASLLIVAGAIFTGYHNTELYGRWTTSKLVAVIPAVLLDGSMLLLLVGFIFWFTDPKQKVVAALFNLTLFLIIGVNTSLNFSLNTGEALSGGMRLYLKIGLIVSFLLTLGAWMLIFHLDPIVKQHEEKAALNAEAQRTAHEMEVEQMQLELERQKAELEYQNGLAQAMHAARMKALGSTEVKNALVDFEKQQAINEAREIRGALPK
jgi:hypothetical protein